MCSIILQPEDPAEPKSVLLPLPKSDSGSTSQEERSDVVPWQPSHIDWSPWTNRSSYESVGPLAQLEPKDRAVQTSQHLFSELAERKANDPMLQKVSVLMVDFSFSDLLKEDRIMS